MSNASKKANRQIAQQSQTTSTPVDQTKTDENLDANKDQSENQSENSTENQTEDQAADQSGQQDQSEQQDQQDKTESESDKSEEEVKNTEIVDPVETEAEVQPKPTNQEGFKAVYKIELNLNSYAEAMDKSKSIDPVEGGKWQYSLYTTIRSIFNAKDQEEFNNEWTTLLNFFEKNKEGIFNENFIFRFPEQWTGSQTEFTLFRRLLHTVLNTSNPVTRAKGVNFINLNVVTEGLQEVQRNRLFNFYQI